ncbi:DDE domain [Puniceibacterium sp. IMCC21224]|nr:DDE domain [Puniceibacterium sp. IMCC21224]
MDEVVIMIRSKKHWLWRGIDVDGDVLDILVQTRRNAKAAKRFSKDWLPGLTNRGRSSPTNCETLSNRSKHSPRTLTIAPTKI